MFMEPAAAKIDRKCVYDSKSASARGWRIDSAKGRTTATGTLCSVFSPQRAHKTRAASTTQMPLQKLPSSSAPSHASTNKRGSVPILYNGAMTVFFSLSKINDIFGI
jgi:hypothetical protein